MPRPLKIILTILLCILPSAFHGDAEAGSGAINFTSYYPAPIGRYKSIHLTGQTSRPDTNCDIGTIYVDLTKNSTAYYCSSLAPSTSPFSQYQLLPGVWGLDGATNSLYIVTSPAPPSNLNNLKVGIGTVSPSFKLSLDKDGGILADDSQNILSALPPEAQSAGTRLLFYPAKLAFRAGYVPGSEWDEDNIGIGSTAMGYQNQTTGMYSTILGGRNNALNKDYSFIGGGFSNSSVGKATNIIGGNNNHILSETRYHVVGGANNNITCAQNGCGILGGANNVINGDRGNTIGGGNQNSLIGINSFIGGGLQNNISTTNEGQTILGGRQNITGQLFNTILGGINNHVYGAWGSIGGGNGNNITASSLAGPANPPTQATIGGGLSNTITGLTDPVTSTTINGTISGGRSNLITGDAPTNRDERVIAGGLSNTASGISTTILGGKSNNAGGSYSVIVGGDTNNTQADNSLVAGRNMRLDNLAVRSFRWGYVTTPPPAPVISNPDSFTINSGRIGIRDVSPAALLEINANASTTDNYLALTSNTLNTTVPGDKLIIKNNGNGTASIGVGVTNPTRPLEFSNGAYVDITGKFMPGSSRQYKENIVDLSIPQAIDTLSGLNPVRYYYKNDKSEEYVGFIAEDVPALVVNEPRDGLTPMDIAAVLNKVIQHQQQVLQTQEQKTEQLLKEVQELENRFKRNQLHE